MQALHLDFSISLFLVQFLHLAIGAYKIDFVGSTSQTVGQNGDIIIIYYLGRGHDINVIYLYLCVINVILRSETIL